MKCLIKRMVILFLVAAALLAAGCAGKGSQLKSAESSEKEAGTGRN